MPPSGAPRPWPLVSSQRLHAHDVLTVRRDRSLSPRTGALGDFVVVEARDGVTVVALTPERELVLIEQYRHGTRSVSLETPSGLMEPGEPPEEAARRELREETGYEAGSVRAIGEVPTNPAWESARTHVVLALGARLAGEPELDPGEDVRTLRVPLDEVWARVREGAIDSAVVLAALLLFRLHADEADAG